MFRRDQRKETQKMLPTEATPNADGLLQRVREMKCDKSHGTASFYLQGFTSQDRCLQTDPAFKNGTNYAAKFMIRDLNTGSNSRVNETPKNTTPINLSTAGEQSSTVEMTIPPSPPYTLQVPLPSFQQQPFPRLELLEKVQQQQFPRLEILEKKIVPPPPPYNVQVSLPSFQQQAFPSTSQALVSAEQYLQSLQLAANKRIILNSPLNQMSMNSPMQHLPLHLPQDGINLQSAPEVIANEIPEFHNDFDQELDHSENQSDVMVSVKKNALEAILGNLDVTWSILQIAMLEQRADMLTVIPMIDNLVKSSIDGIMNLASIEKSSFNLTMKSILPPPQLQQIRTVQGHGRMGRSKMRNMHRASSHAIPLNSPRNNCGRNQQGIRGEPWGYFRAQGPNSNFSNVSVWDNVGQPQYNSPFYHPYTRNAYPDMQQSEMSVNFQPQSASTPTSRMEGLCHQFSLRTDQGGHYGRPSQAQYNQQQGRGGRGGKAQCGIRRSARNKNN